MVSRFKGRTSQEQHVGFVPGTSDFQIFFSFAAQHLVERLMVAEKFPLARRVMFKRAKFQMG